MTALALISGVLFRTAEQKTSKAGNPYVSATIRVRDGDASTFWRITVFSESAQAELLRLSEGDALAAQGAMRVELYTPEGGEPRISLSHVADNVLALRRPREERKRRVAELPVRSQKPAPERSSFSRHGCDGTDHFGDDIPF